MFFQPLYETDLRGLTLLSRQWNHSQRSQTTLCPSCIHWEFSASEDRWFWCGGSVTRVGKNLRRYLKRTACWEIFHAFVVICWHFSKLFFFKKFFQEHYQSVKWFGSRSGPTVCRSWSGSKLFATVISRQQKWQLARKELKMLVPLSGY